jgi:glycosyltransferase involved in cell wall biosynthesis
LERSLTVLLPVRNAQATLADHVAEILDVVGDLARRFEVVIIDDGSSDATSEVAHDLTRRYPQVRAVRHSQTLGREAAVQTGLRQSRGDLIVLRDEDGALDELPELWRQAWAGLKQAVAGIGQGVQAVHRAAPQPCFPSGYRVMRRRAGDVQPGWSRPARPNYLARSRDLARNE